MLCQNMVGFVTSTGDLSPQREDGREDIDVCDACAVSGWYVFGGGAPTGKICLLCEVGI